MSFLALIVVASLLAYLPQYVFGDRRDYRMAMRHGLAIGLLLTGTDHFVSAETRYLPMMPELLAPVALQLVWLSGLAELAGALGLMLPAGALRRVGWPGLRRLTGKSLALMFSLLVIANINVAIKGSGVNGLNFGDTYFLLRPLLQPVFIWWSLYCVGISMLTRREHSQHSNSSSASRHAGTASV